MHPIPVFTFRLDFKPHYRSPSFLHHFLFFKAWLTSNWSQKLIYNVYSINRMLRYRVWLTQFFTRFANPWSHQFEAFEIQLSSQTISCDHGESVWIANLINYASDCSIFIFLSETFTSVFSQTAQPFREFFVSLCSPLRTLFNDI
jgi:hypothetical protein